MGRCPDGELPVTAADGNVFVSLRVYFDLVPTLFSVDAATGSVLWSRAFVGTLIGNGLSKEDLTRVSYVAAQAFSGEFHITVRRLWGQPLGGKARLEIVQHQGTPKESRQIETVQVDGKAATFKLTLADGRRT